MMSGKTFTGYPDDSLRGILKQKNPGLFGNLEKNWDNAKKTLLDYLTEGDFTSHGLSHCEGIEAKLEELIPVKVKQGMNPAEIYILLNAVLYHDIGMASRKYPNEPQTVRRQEHANRSASIIREKYLELGLLDEAIARRVADVARGHGTSSIDEFDDDDYIEGNYIEGNAVNTRFLVSLLRLGDICDWAKTRAPLFVGDLKWISGESYRYWLEHNLIESIRPKPEQRSIIVTTLPKGEWSEKWLKKFIEWLNDELQVNSSTLLSKGMPYTKFESKPKKDDLKSSVKPDRKGSNPFQFLCSYDNDTRDIFFGREQEVDEFIGKLFANRVNILVGESGVGKTSFLLAGVRPAINELSFLDIYMDDYLKGVESLKQRIHSKIPLNFDNSINLLDSLKFATQKKKRVLVILDQFEKNFIPDYNTDFLETLAQIIITQDIEVKIVIALRRDFIDNLWKFSNEYGLNLMKVECRTGIDKADAKTVRKIIENSVKVSQIRFEEDVIDAIINDLKYQQKSDTIFLPDLQITCGSFVEYLLENKIPKASMDEYQRLGGSEELVASYFRNGIWKGFIQSEVSVARKLIGSLVDSEGRRIQRTMEEIVQKLRCGTEEVQRIISQLTDRRLMRRIVEERNPNSTSIRYELIHDFLAKTITEELTEGEKKEKFALESWEAVKRDWKREVIPMGKARLDYLGKYVHAFNLTDDDKEMILQNLEKENYIDNYWCQVFNEPWIKRILTVYIENIETITIEIELTKFEKLVQSLIKKYYDWLPSCDYSLSGIPVSERYCSLEEKRKISNPLFIERNSFSRKTPDHQILFSLRTGERYHVSQELKNSLGYLDVVEPKNLSEISPKKIKRNFYGGLLLAMGARCMSILENELLLLLKDFEHFKENYKMEEIVLKCVVFWSVFRIMDELDTEQTFKFLSTNLSPSDDNESCSLIIDALMFNKNISAWTSLPQYDLKKIAKSANALQLLKICGLFMDTNETKTKFLEFFVEPLSEKIDGMNEKEKANIETKTKFLEFFVEPLSEKIDGMNEKEKANIFSINDYRDVLVQLKIPNEAVYAVTRFREAKTSKEKLNMINKALQVNRLAAIALVSEGLADKDNIVKCEVEKIANEKCSWLLKPEGDYLNIKIYC